MRCPSCNAEVEEGADLCLECGEPMGDSPAARVARADATTQKPSAAVAPSAVAPTEPAPRAPAKLSSKLTATVSGKRSARRRDDDDDREPVRCPGCGIPTKAARCPGCGIPLRTDE
jgi:hypothetical protein